MIHELTSVPNSKPSGYMPIALDVVYINFMTYVSIIDGLFSSLTESSSLCWCRILQVSDHRHLESYLSRIRFSILSVESCMFGIYIPRDFF